MSISAIYNQNSKVSVIDKGNKTNDELKIEINEDIDNKKIQEYILQSISTDATFVYLIYQNITLNQPI